MEYPSSHLIDLVLLVKTKYFCYDLVGKCQKKEIKVESSLHLFQYSTKRTLVFT